MVQQLVVKDVNAIARIHHTSMRGDFLTLFGVSFLEILYRQILKDKDCYGFCYKIRGDVKGFVIGIKESKSILKQIVINNFLGLLRIVIVKLIKSPVLIINILETFNYSFRSGKPGAELLVIAIDKEYRNKGIGKLLIERLEMEYRKNGIYEYKLTVHSDKMAVGFYKHLRYREVGRFKLYNKDWTIYKRRLK